MDVNLTVTPIDPSPSQDLNILVPVDKLRILASDASIPPAIVATDRTPQGIKLIFNKPMDPVQASNVKNYFVYSQTVQGSDFGSPASWLETTPVPLKSAEYDAATNTVTLIPRRRLTSFGGINVTQGHPAHAAGGPNTGTGATHELVDLEGQPIDQTTTPGKFRPNVSKGYYPNLGYWEA